jgi:threonine synthase
VFERFGVMIDPHTADGVKVGLEHREPLTPLICLETALPVKFASTLRAALGREPERPAELAELEKLPQRFQVVANDAGALKRYIESAR